MVDRRSAENDEVSAAASAVRESERLDVHEPTFWRDDESSNGVPGATDALLAPDVATRSNMSLDNLVILRMEAVDPRVENMTGIEIPIGGHGPIRRSTSSPGVPQPGFPWETPIGPDGRPADVDVAPGTPTIGSLGLWQQQGESVVLAIHAALLADGRVVYFGGSEYDFSWGQRWRWRDSAEYDEWRNVVGRVGIWNPRTRDVTVVTGGHYDTWCSSHAFLGDGSLLIVGGAEFYAAAIEVGIHRKAVHASGPRSCARFDVAANPPVGAVVRVPDMHFHIDRFQPRRALLEGGGRWYPTVLTLSDGRVLCFGGHPTWDDPYELFGPGLRTMDHENLRVEVYDPTAASGGAWLDYGLIATPVPGTDRFEPGEILGPGYAKAHLLPDGTVLVSDGKKSSGSGVASFLWDPEAYVAPSVGRQADRRRSPWTELSNGPPFAGLADAGLWSSALLPLVPPYFEWTIVGTGPGNDSLETTGQGQWSTLRGDVRRRAEYARETAWAGRRARPGFARLYAIATLLPNGALLLTPGISGLSMRADLPRFPRHAWDSNAETEALMFTPYLMDGESTPWSVLATATVPRNYHATALLLADGSVWTAGSNRDSYMAHDPLLAPAPTWSIDHRPLSGPALGGASAPSGTVSNRELRIERFYPPYFGSRNRPVIVSAPSVGRRGESSTRYFDIELEQTATMEMNAVLMRCGSATHGFNADQRCVVLRTVWARDRLLRVEMPPPNPLLRGVLPPGPYFLHVVDGPVDGRGVPSTGVPFRVV